MLRLGAAARCSMGACEGHCKLCSPLGQQNPCWLCVRPMPSAFCHLLTCRFRGQYAMEAACALTACGLLWSTGGGSVRSGLSALAGGSGWMLAGAAGILLLELGLVFPALDLRGKALIASAAEPAALTPRQQAYVQELQDATANRSLPPPYVHLVSVLLALAQAALLGGCLWSLLLKLG